MCRISSLGEAKTVIMEIQINSARSKFELEDNGQLRSHRLDLIQYCFNFELISLLRNKTYLRIQNHSKGMWDYKSSDMSPEY